MERAGRLSTPGPDAHSLLTVLRKTCFQPLFPELTETSGFAPAKPLVPTDCSVFKSQQTPPQDAKSHPLPTTRNQVYPQGYRGFESHPLRQLRNSHHRSVSGFAENCAMMGISSLSARIRFAGFRAEKDGGRGSWLASFLSTAPRRSKLHIACSGFFQKSERARFAAPPFQTGPASPGSDLALGAGLIAISSLTAFSSSEIPAAALLPACFRLKKFLEEKGRLMRRGGFWSGIPGGSTPSAHGTVFRSSWDCGSPPGSKSPSQAGRFPGAVRRRR